MSERTVCVCASMLFSICITYLYVSFICSAQNDEATIFQFKNSLANTHKYTAIPKTTNNTNTGTSWDFFSSHFSYTTRKSSLMQIKREHKYRRHRLQQYKYHILEEKNIIKLNKKQKYKEKNTKLCTNFHNSNVYKSNNIGN